MVDGVGGGTVGERAEVVDRLPQCIDDAAEPGDVRPDFEVVADPHRRAETEARRRREQFYVGAVRLDADDLAEPALTAALDLDR